MRVRAGLIHAIVGLALTCCSCSRPAGPSQEDLRQYLAQPQMQLKNYGFDAQKPLEERIGPCPGFLVEALKGMDNRTDYQPYSPSPEELRLLRGYLGTLPPRMRQAFAEKLVGIYLVKNFLGNGMSNWILDDEKRVYAWLVLNPAALEKNLSETLTAREASVFQGDAGVAVDCGTRYKGILYTILHEGLHVYDYVHGVTPYVERMVVRAVRGGQGLGASWDVWEEIDRPKLEADYPLRDKIRFYGLGGGPAIAAADAPRLYQDLAASPFASLYGSQTWAEDAAELFTFQHITKALGQPYAIRLAGPSVLTVEPMKAGQARDRAERLYGPLYEPARR